jgi:CDP-6-deoxy-D-xylo-4-hexulose-3-dehydrase
MESDQPTVPFSQAVYGEKEKAAVNDVLDSGDLVSYGQGNYMPAFEDRIASEFGKTHGIMLNSGSSANLLATELLDFPPGTEVITPVVTFITTVAPILQQDLVPVFTDVGIPDYQVDVDQVEDAITEETGAIMVPNLIGNVPDWPRLREIADEHDLVLVEDSCDVIGATIDGNPTGTYTDITTTSFYESHIITSLGAGGMIMVDDTEARNRLRVLRNWGRNSAVEESEEFDQRWDLDIDGITYDARFIFAELGYNFLPTEAQAAFGLEQSKKLPEFVDHRQEVYRELDAFFAEYPEYFITPDTPDNVDTAWLAYPLTITEDAPFERLDLIEHLWVADVEARPFFSGNILRHPAFDDIEKRTVVDEFTNADRIMRSTFRIGCHQGMGPQELSHVKATFEAFVNDL